jgi:hypothetical protein
MTKATAEFPRQAKKWRIDDVSRKTPENDKEI